MYKDYLRYNDKQQEHLVKNIDEYKKFGILQDVSPKIIIGTPLKDKYTNRELIDSPENMLKNALQNIKAHIDVGDDFIPQMRVEFGTGQVASAFGCDMYVPNDSPPCAKNHILDNVDMIYDLKIPSLDAGWFRKCYEFTEYFLENKPDIVSMQLPDFQSPFNNAHLIRGNDILYDFYDYPEAVEVLLTKVTDYQISIIENYRKMANIEDGYYCDWGALWKGGARISNCTLHMISNNFYYDYIKKHDSYLLSKISGGRIHYCGEHDDGLLSSFCTIDGMNGLDFDTSLHDLWEVCKFIPDNVTLMVRMTNSMRERILSGDPPKKRNIIYLTGANSIEEARKLYNSLKIALG